jgi:hypothetical protein
MGAWAIARQPSDCLYREMVPEMRAARRERLGLRKSGAFVAFVAYVAPLLLNKLRRLREHVSGYGQALLCRGASSQTNRCSVMPLSALQTTGRRGESNRSDRISVSAAHAEEIIEEL